MKKIAVFDLDGTLLPFDSFRRLLLRNMWRSPGLVKVMLERTMGLLTREAFSEKIHRRLQPVLVNDRKLDIWLSELDQYSDPQVRKSNEALRADGVTTVLLSASPQDYVAPLGARLGFDFSIGSHWDSGCYVHLYGVNKTMFIEKIFPQSEWDWFYAVGDSDSDDHLLSHFRKSERIRRA